MTNTTSPLVFTSGAVEVEAFPEVAVLTLWNEEDFTDRLVTLNLSESEALEIGLLLIQAHHSIQAARIARGDARVYSESEIADAHTIAARYPLVEE